MAFVQLQAPSEGSSLKDKIDAMGENAKEIAQKIAQEISHPLNYVLNTIALFREI